MTLATNANAKLMSTVFMDFIFTDGSFGGLCGRLLNCQEVEVRRRHLKILLAFNTVVGSSRNGDLGSVVLVPVPLLSVSISLGFTLARLQRGNPLRSRG